MSWLSENRSVCRREANVLTTLGGEKEEVSLFRPYASHENYRDGKSARMVFNTSSNAAEAASSVVLLSTM